MPITFEIDKDDRLVVFHHVGDVSDDELIAFYSDFFGDAEAAEYSKLLIVLEKTKSTGRSSQALRALAGFLGEAFKGDQDSRRVAVVAPADHSFGMARMYEVFSGHVPWEFRVFRDSPAAREWLGVG